MQSIVNLDAVFVILNRVQAKRRVENMSEKILIIDDEQDIADLLEVYLKNENYISVFYVSYIFSNILPYNAQIDFTIACHEISAA